LRERSATVAPLSFSVFLAARGCLPNSVSGIFEFIPVVIAGFEPVGSPVLVLTSPRLNLLPAQQEAYRLLRIGVNGDGTIPNGGFRCFCPMGPPGVCLAP